MRCRVSSRLAAVAVALRGTMAAVTYVNTLVIPGEDTDLASQPLPGFTNSRLGGFFSDLFFDSKKGVYYGTADRGAGGGVFSYDTRVQKFHIDVNKDSGAISNFDLLDTIVYEKDGVPLNGLSPDLLNGNPSEMGLSFDPEGFVVHPKVSDEYGPSIYEFTPDGGFIRAFEQPPNVIPFFNLVVDYVDTPTYGRVPNRGWEGLAISPNGEFLYAMLQDPLQQEGDLSQPNPGRLSRNVRIAEFEVRTGKPGAQYVYQLDPYTEVDLRITNTTTSPFAANQQGQSIAISALRALNDHVFLVLERDNRGLGVDNIYPADYQTGSKRVYKIDIASATDVRDISLIGYVGGALPIGVVPVTKTLFLDIAKQLQANQQIVPEKIEGLTIGPNLNNGKYELLIGTDNDFSVTQQSGSKTQFDVCVDIAANSSYTRQVVNLTDPCPPNYNLIPTFLFRFTADEADLEGFEHPPKDFQMNDWYCGDCASERPKHKRTAHPHPEHHYRHQKKHKGHKKYGYHRRAMLRQQEAISHHD